MICEDGENGVAQVTLPKHSVYLHTDLDSPWLELASIKLLTRESGNGRGKFALSRVFAQPVELFLHTLEGILDLRLSDLRLVLSLDTS